MAIESGRRQPSHEAKVDSKFRGSWSGNERDFLFHNTDGPSPTLPNAGYVCGLDFDDDGRAAAPVDIDGDGDLDLVILSLQGLRLVENTSPKRRFLRLRLEGAKGRIDALDAMVRVVAGGVTQQEYVRLTDGFQTQVPFELHFGLGDAKVVDRVEITWPGGEKQTVVDVPVDRLVTVRRGREGFADADLPRWPVREARPVRPAFSFDLAANKLEGGKGPLASRGRPVVVSFLAPGTGPTQGLTRVADRHRDLVQFAGVAAEGAAALPGIPLFVADADLLAAFFGPGATAAVPATFVFDGNGALRRAFRREVGEEELSSLLDSFRDEGTGAAEMNRRGSRSHQLGRDDEAREWIEKALAADPESGIGNCYMGLALLSLNRPDEALVYLRRATQFDPEYWNSWFNLGAVLNAKGDFKGAIEAYERADKLKVDDVEIAMRLGSSAARAGQAAAALAAFERAVKLAPGNATAWAVKGELHFALGQLAPSKECFAKAQAIDPNEPLSRNYLKQIEKMEKERK